MSFCYACDPANPDRIFTPDADGWSAGFDGHFNGPPGVVNGGVAAAALACPARSWAHRNGASYPLAVRVTARLRRPVPVATGLRAAAAAGDDGAVDVTVARDGEALVLGSVRLLLSLIHI